MLLYGAGAVDVGLLVNWAVNRQNFFAENATVVKNLEDAIEFLQSTVRLRQGVEARIQHLSREKHRLGNLLREEGSRTDKSLNK